VLTLLVTGRKIEAGNRHLGGKIAGWRKSAMTTPTTADAPTRAAAPLAERLRWLRARAMLTQEELAERARLSVRTVRNLEAGHIRRPRSGSIRLLADALGLSKQERVLLIELAERGPDPALPAASAGGERPARPRPPRLLPPAVADFTGRHQQVATLLELLDRSEPHVATGRSEATALLVISGSAGVGKTALAVHAAHLLGDRFPDGHLFVNLRGYDPAGPLEPARALAGLLYGLGVAPEQIPVEVEEAGGLYRTLLADRRVLVLLDNARSAEQVRPLLPASPGSLVLVTSRDRLTGLAARDGARRLPLGVLAPAEAAELLARLLGRDRVRVEPDAAADLARACAFLPLALRVAAANLADQPGRSIAEYAGQLQAGNRMALLAVDGDPASAVHAAFDLSYQGLDPDARWLFGLLGLVPGPDLTAEAAAALAGLTFEHARRLLGRLAAAHLVDEHLPNRFAFHDLLRDYAADRARRDCGDVDRAAAIGRLLGWYLATTDAARGLLYPARVGLEPPAGDPRLSPAVFGNEQEALAWLDRERANLLAAIHHAAADGPPAMAWLLADALRGYFAARRFNADWEAAARSGLAAATDGNRPAAQAAMHLSLGDLHQSVGRYREAIAQYTAALGQARRAGWVRIQAAILGNLGCVHTNLGQLEQAARYHTAAQALNRQAGRQGWQAINLGNLGIVNAELGRLLQAVDNHTSALAAYQEIGSRDDEAAARSSLGTALRQLGYLDDARDQLTRALLLNRTVGDRHGEAVNLNDLAAIHCEAGRYAEALDLANAALALARDIDDRDSEALVSNTLAAIQRSLGEPSGAMSHSRDALRLAREVGFRHPEVVALLGLAAAHRHLGQLQRARARAEQALTQARQTGYRILEGQALTILADLHLAAAGSGQAAAHAFQAADIQHATGHRLGEAHALLILGHALHHTGDTAAAEAAWRDALTLFTSIGTPEADQVRALLPVPQALGSQPLPST
jgi:tetratricopeptide (TPR) repeat protein/transcriptional regulator with XRE-family HTH domain